jgi:CRP/FNR family transcriptional regulator, cyclic AMP receptor protein
VSEPTPIPPAVYTVADGDIFGELPDEVRAQLARQISSADYPTGHIFYSPDDEGESIYVLMRGRVRIYKLSLEGRALTLLVLEPLAIFGEMAISEHWKHDSFAESMSECQVGTIQRSVLRQVLARYPSTAMRLMGIMSDRMRAMERKLADIAFKSVSQRLATVLLSLAHPDGQGGPATVLRYTHQQLAEMIGSYRETVTKTIGDFREAGMIRIEDEVIFLLAEDRLRAMVS